MGIRWTKGEPSFSKRTKREPGIAPAPPNGPRTNLGLRPRFQTGCARTWDYGCVSKWTAREPGIALGSQTIAAHAVSVCRTDTVAGRNLLRMLPHCTVAAAGQCAPCHRRCRAKPVEPSLSVSGAVAVWVGRTVEPKSPCMSVRKCRCRAKHVEQNPCAFGVVAVWVGCPAEPKLPCISVGKYASNIPKKRHLYACLSLWQIGSNQQTNLSNAQLYYGKVVYW